MVANGEQPPERYLCPPPGLDPALEDQLIDAFFTLDTCRDSGFGLGPIPWTAIDAYARGELGLGGDRRARLVFREVVRAMDASYRTQEQARMDALRKRG